MVIEALFEQRAGGDSLRSTIRIVLWNGGHGRSEASQDPCHVPHYMGIYRQ